MSFYRELSDFMICLHALSDLTARGYAHLGPEGQIMMTLLCLKFAMLIWGPKANDDDVFV